MNKKTAAKRRDSFLDWQCRIRQVAMREEGGRPSPGMRPRVLEYPRTRNISCIDSVNDPQEAG